MRVVVFGTYDTAVHPRSAVLIEGLSQRGFTVTQINAPLRLSTASRVSILQQPWRLPTLLGRLSACWMRILVASLRAPRPDVVLIPYLGHFDVLLARARWPRRRIVLDHLVSAEATARDRGVRRGPRLRLLKLLDTLALRAADDVVVDTDESATRLPEGVRPRAVVVPVGASDAWFAARREPTMAERPLRVVFFGSFTPLQGTTTIARALGRVEAGLLAVTLLGTGQDHDEVRRILKERTDVAWHDWVASEDLPEVVADHEVCLGIFGQTDKALSVVPTKIYQGAAAGCALVTSDTTPQRRALEDAAVFVPPGDDAALARALTALATDRPEVGRLREAAAARATHFTSATAVAPLVARLGHHLVQAPRSRSASFGTGPS